MLSARIDEWRAARVRRIRIARLPTVLDGLARELRAGATLYRAVRVVAADPASRGSELDRVVRRIDAGDGVAESVDRWAAALAHPDADLVRAVLNTGVTTGGAMAASLDRAAASLRERVELRREIAALSAQARVSALVLTISPLLFLALMAALDPSVVSVVGSGVGLIFVVSGLVLDAVGWWWMRRLVDEVSR